MPSWVKSKAGKKQAETIENRDEENEEEMENLISIMNSKKPQNADY